MLSCTKTEDYQGVISASEAENHGPMHKTERPSDLMVIQIRHTGRVMNKHHPLLNLVLLGIPKNVKMTCSNNCCDNLL